MGVVGSVACRQFWAGGRRVKWVRAWGGFDERRRRRNAAAKEYARRLNYIPSRQPPSTREMSLGCFVRAIASRLCNCNGCSFGHFACCNLCGLSAKLARLMLLAVGAAWDRTSVLRMMLAPACLRQHFFPLSIACRPLQGRSSPVDECPCFSPWQLQVAIAASSDAERALAMLRSQ